VTRILASQRTSRSSAWRNEREENFENKIILVLEMQEFGSLSW